MLRTPVSVDTWEKNPQNLGTEAAHNCDLPSVSLWTRLRFKRCNPRLWKMSRVSRFKFVDWRSPEEAQYRHENPQLSSKDY
ncbi:hypothetical protein [Microcoleus sp. CAWBG58]|uniref:hypothetical protein n=1 Tax=Microcoleus sp. CAWBG58 TaxID=2841651 RepID=UPI0025D421D0|nr:hypothetical protein [Microcoleus sp. CAWBG58]